MHGQQETTRFPRILTTLLHSAAVALAAWLLLRDGSLNTRDILLIGCSLIYLGRTVFGMFVLLKRKFAWSEAFIVTGLFSGLHLGFAYLATQHTGPIGTVDIIAVLLYLWGSYLNTGSEYQRHIWKKDQAHKGKLYSEGLFKHSMHINYFGDSVLFSGFAMLTGSHWAFVVPGVMTVGFIFQHIPALDTYLAKRYGKQFELYASKTKKFIPYIY